jgi:hypothetical protein
MRGRWRRGDTVQGGAHQAVPRPDISVPLRRAIVGSSFDKFLYINVLQLSGDFVLEARKAHYQ